MGRMMNRVKRLLYRHLSLEAYLKTVSRLFFMGFRWGIAPRSDAYEYPHFLKHLVRKGDTVVDIGANLGYYSRIMSRLIGREGKLYAVEPVGPILGVLKHNLRKCRNVQIMPYALGAEEQTVTMANDTVSICGFMGTGRNYVAQYGDSACNADLTFRAEMKRGSRLFGSLDRLDFIKCDIEGYESVVMAEMSPLLDRCRPVVLIETAGPNRKRILKLFRELGYAGFVLQNGRLISVMRAPEKDIVFIPAHRYDDFKDLIEQ